VVVGPFVAVRYNTDPCPSALANTFTSIFDRDVNNRSLLSDIVKHWLTILVEETHVDQETVGRFYNDVATR